MERSGSASDAEAMSSMSSLTNAPGSFSMSSSSSWSFVIFLHFILAFNESLLLPPLSLALSNTYLRVLDDSLEYDPSDEEDNSDSCSSSEESEDADESEDELLQSQDEFETERVDLSEFSDNIVQCIKRLRDSFDDQSHDPVTTLQDPTILHFTEIDSLLLFGNGAGISEFMKNTIDSHGFSTCQIHVQMQKSLRKKISYFKTNLVNGEVRSSLDFESNAHPDEVIQVATCSTALGIFSVLILFGSINRATKDYNDIARSLLVAANAQLRSSNDPVRKSYLR